MKTLLLTAMIALTSAAAFAQGGRPGGPGGPGGRGGPGGGDPLEAITRAIQDPAAMKTSIGLTDAQADTLQKSLADFDAKIRAKDAELQKLAVEQAGVIAKSLADKTGAADAELAAQAEKVSKATTERAALRVQRVLAVKAVLNDDQIAKAVALVKERAAIQERINKAIADGDFATVRELSQQLNPGGGGGRPGGQ